jgi:acyl dehydratase
MSIDAIHAPVARNFALSSENKIHSDDIAKRFGFTGALVPGVTVFGHLTWPLTKRLGSRWLQGSVVTTRFIKPAYDGERLTITDAESASGLSVTAQNASDVLLANLDCQLDELPPVDERIMLRGLPGDSERIPIAWDTVLIGEPFAPYAWQPDAAHNLEYAARLDDATELFQQGVLHPHAILSQANQALVRHFIMPAWIHTASEIRFRQLLRIGDSIEVRAVPVDKWEKKGHQFIKLYIAYIVGDDVATEIEHTAIFRVAGN